MKYAVLALPLLIPRTAAACPPIPTCGDQFCQRSTAVVEAVVEQVEGPPDDLLVTIEVTQAFGEISLGSFTLPAAPDSAFAIDIGQTRLFSIQRDASNQLVIDQQLARQSSDYLACFGDRPVSEVAEILLSPTCVAFDPVQLEREPCAENGCNAGGGSGAALALLGLIGLVIRRR